MPRGIQFICTVWWTYLLKDLGSCITLSTQDGYVIGPGCENAEDIHLTGTLNIVTTTANGKTIRQFHPQDITGVGLTTGTTYRGTGGTIIIGDPNNDGETHTYVNIFNIIATEPAGISSIEHQVLHITVNAQGEITADVAPTEHNSCR
jgi:hypothetical protein